MKTSSWLFIFFIIVVSVFVIAYIIANDNHKVPINLTPPTIGTKLIPYSWNKLSSEPSLIYTFNATTNLINGQETYITPTPTLNSNVIAGKTGISGSCYDPDQLAIEEVILGCTGFGHTGFTINKCVTSNGQLEPLGATYLSYQISGNIKPCTTPFGVLSLNFQPNNCNNSYVSCINFGCFKAVNSNNENYVTTSYPCDITDPDQLLSVNLQAFKTTSVYFRNLNMYLNYEGLSSSITMNTGVNNGTAKTCQGIGVNVSGYSVNLSPKSNNNWYYVPSSQIQNSVIGCTGVNVTYGCNNSQITCTSVGSSNINGYANIPAQLVYIGNISNFNSCPLATQKYQNFTGIEAIVNYAVDTNLLSLYSLGNNNYLGSTLLLLPFCNNANTLCSLRNSMSGISQNPQLLENPLITVYNVPSSCLSKGYDITFLPYKGFNDTWV